MSSTFKPRTAVVTIWAGDDLDQIRHLERLAEAAKAAEDADGPRLNSDVPEYLELAREHDELVKAAEERATHVRVQALPRKVWTALVAAHPPRTVEKDKVSQALAHSDTLSGVNDETFKEALVLGGTVDVAGQPVTFRSVVEPDLEAEDFDALSAADFDRLYLTAFGLNRGRVADPKASLVSRLSQTNDETSS